MTEISHHIGAVLLSDSGDWLSLDAVRTEEEAPLRLRLGGKRLTPEEATLLANLLVDGCFRVTGDMLLSTLQSYSSGQRHQQT